MLKFLEQLFERSNDRLELKRFELSTLKRELTREKDLETMIRLWKIFQARKVTTYDNFFNVCIFASLVGRDMDYLTNSYVKTLIIRERNILGRLLSMTLIEFLDDINTLLGKHLRVELQKTGFTQHIDELNQINKAFAAIKGDNQKQLRNIRNNASAHKTKNAMHLLEYNNNLDLDRIFEISANVSKTNAKLTQLTTEIIYSIIDQSNQEIESLKIESEQLKADIRDLKSSI